MTWRRPRLDADRPDLAKGGFDQAERFRLKTAMVSVDTGQTLAGSLETVEFDDPPDVVYDTVNQGTLSDDIEQIWDTTAHAWVIPAGTRYVQCYSEVRCGAAEAAGTFVSQFAHSAGPTVYGFVTYYAAAAGKVATLSAVTPIVLVDPGDTIKLQISHDTGEVDETITEARFSIEFLEA